VSGATAETVAILALVAALAFAVLRPRGLTEALVALPAAALVVGLGVVSVHQAGDALHRIGPTVGFLAAILVFGHLCAEAGVFDYLGAVAARASGGNPRRLLALVVVLAALVTATLTLDATVVLLTPVVLSTVATLGVAARPHAYACLRLANSGSLLLPVSNLTNLLAFGATGLSFGRFTALMLLPWLLVVVAEWAGLRRFFARDLRTDGTGHLPPRPAAPGYALCVLIVTVGLFAAASVLHVAPAWAALAGCCALLAPRVAARDVALRRLVQDASLGFCVFVLALAVLVDGVTRHGLGSALHHVVPDGSSFPALLATAAIAAVLANLVNNLPATLVLVPVAVASIGPVGALAVLLGVNIGPNAAYPGSLATLLWRRILPADVKPRAREFHTFGALTVPVLLVLATAALWAGVQVVGV